MKIINFEIKARCNDLDKIELQLLQHNALFKGLDLQTDTYFKVEHGRLKLREGTIENRLIHYKRENLNTSKLSEVILYESMDSGTLKSILVQSLAILITVKKSRKIFFIENIKFHLDTIEQLGTFIEIEAIGSDVTHSNDYLKDQCKNFSMLLGINDEDLINNSYSDMLLKINNKG